MHRACLVLCGLLLCFVLVSGDLVVIPPAPPRLVAANDLDVHAWAASGDPVTYTNVQGRTSRGRDYSAWLATINPKYFSFQGRRGLCVCVGGGVDVCE